LGFSIQTNKPTGGEARQSGAMRHASRASTGTKVAPLVEPQFKKVTHNKAEQLLPK
jgi:hypothetical protein